MQPKRRFMWLLALLAAFSLVAAACGDDDDDDAETDTTEEDSGEEATDDTEAPDEGAEGEDEGDEAMMDLSGTLDGAGASSQAAAMQGWVAGFQGVYPDVTVNYDPIGSGGGREAFTTGAVSFAGSDGLMDEEEYAAAVDTCAGDLGAIHLPHYISPVAAAFNLPDIETLNMSPATLAGIFAETITNWNDDAIAADNPDVELPDMAITPVHRSDESGTTENFTDYLATVAPDVWTFGEVESWPGDLGGEGAAQTSGVVQAITAGEGAIGYADASQVSELGTVAIGVGDDFVEFSPEAAARIVDVSERIEGNGEFDFPYALQRDTTEAGTYPIALVSYHIVCLEYATQEEADLVKAFMTYIGSPEGQDAAAASAGSAPISDDLREQLSAAVDAIGVAG